MNEALKKIYRVAELRTTCKSFIRFCRINEMHSVKICFENGFKNELVWLYDEILKVDNRCAQELVNTVTKSFHCVGQNNPAAADIMEGSVIPIINWYIKKLPQFSITDDSNSWEIIPTDSGYLSLKSIKHFKSIHSTIDPMEEARLQAINIYNPQIEEYVILGCGLGYLPYQLYLISDGSAKITVFESIPLVGELAKEMGVIGFIPEDILDFRIEEDYLKCLEYVADNEAFLYLNSTIIDCEVPKNERQILDSLMIRQNTIFSFKHLQTINECRNVSYVRKLFTDIDWVKEGKKYYIIAAGPSLDMGIDKLKGLDRDNSIIICVGRALDKLISNDIIPDFTVAIDAQRQTANQFISVKDAKVPLIISSVCSWKVARTYEGPTYMAIKYGTSNELDRYGQENNQPVINPGGTVTQFAIEIALYWKASEIHLIGVDLAYPDGKKHTSGTFEENRNGFSETKIVVNDVNGNNVETTHVFYEYIKNIEESIENNPEVRFYNHSEIGALIRGANRVDS